MDNLFLEKANSLLRDNKAVITLLSNASALIYEEMDKLNWAGFYLLKGDTLLLGPFQGKVACTEIKIGKGVCGTCIKEDSTIIVDNVLECKNHIACDSNSRSEICIPIHINNELYGLLDIDSPICSRFSQNDKDYLEKLVKIIEENIEKIDNKTIV